LGDVLKCPEKGLSKSQNLNHVFGQVRRPAKMLRAGLYARVSTNDQQTLAMQNRAMREYAARRGWMIALQVREVNSGAAKTRSA
jgi:predicted site-specific integrase-resolvase